MRSILRWLLGQGALYLGLVLAVAFATLVLPEIRDRLGQGGLAAELMSPEALIARFAQDRDAAVSATVRLRQEIAAAPAQEVQRRLGQARVKRADIDRQLQERPGLFASLSPQDILARKQIELERATVDGEIALLEAAGRRHSLNTDLQAYQALANKPVDEAARACRTAIGNVRAFKTRIPLEQSARNLVFQDEARLRAAGAAACSRYDKVTAARNTARRRMQQAQIALTSAASAYASVGQQAEAAVARVSLDSARTFRSILLTAAGLLAAMLATPYLIRLLFYYVLAPIAQRRPAIRLRSDLGVTPPTLSHASATSAPITLRAGEELLVRQGYLQSTSTLGAKRTRALLNGRHPLSSLASGLAFLTRIVGDGETTTVSAVDDPFAEVAVLCLAEGGACVLQPRALVAVVQRTDRPLRITSHWRLLSLHAWLTLQLRYLMFHGPCRLVLKGGRGIRVERAESGRMFGQDQLVGFSPDLAYTVARTETFWPYFVGRDALLKDRVEAGGGVLIIEEAPMGGGRRRSRKGLEGAFDLALKAVGL